METTRLSPRGQTVIPHRIRQQYGWDSGVEFAVEVIDGGIALRQVSELPPTTVEGAGRGTSRPASLQVSRWTLNARPGVVAGGPGPTVPQLEVHREINNSFRVD